MAETKKELDIKDLPGIGAASAEKLVAAGFSNLFNIATATSGQIIDAAGITQATAKKAIQSAREHLKLGFVNGSELVAKREKVVKITTGSKAFDKLLGGGFETGSITECFGEFGCVSNDTMITLADGRMVEIGEIANGQEQGEYALNLPILAWNNNKLIETIATKLFVYDCGSLIKFSLDDGREIKTTPNHPLMSSNGWKRADELKIDDSIAVCWPDKFTKELVKLSTTVNLHKKSPKKSIKIAKLPPYLDENLAGILGYYLGEGWHEYASNDGGVVRVSIGSSDKQIINDWKNLVNLVFGLDATTKKIKGNTETWSINSVIVGEFLKQFKGIYNTAREKFIPQQIFNSPKGVVSRFLAALYDAEGNAFLEEGTRDKIATWKLNDGTIKEKEYTNKKSGKAIGLRSSSLKLLQQTQLLLSKFRMKSRITKDVTRGFICYRLSIYTKQNILKFYENIGQNTVRLKNKIERIIKDYKRDLATDYNILKITHIEHINNEHGKVYDIEVPQTHSFLANNIVSHNSGKTQLCHVLAVRAQAPDKTGKKGAVVYIDTEATFRPERIKSIAKALKFNEQEILNNIKYARAFNSDHQMLLAEKIEKLITEDKIPIRLVVIDSLTAHFRAEFIGRGTLAERQQKLNIHMRTLVKIADSYNIGIYVTNQVMAKPDTFFGDPTLPIGGHIVAHNSQTRVYLRKGKKGSRVAKLIDSPHLPDGACSFYITENGLKDCQTK